MGKVIVIEHLTLDGVMQAPGHPEEDPRDGFQHGGWANRRQDPAMQEVMGARMSSAWSLLAGRTTYERFADYWEKDAAGIQLPYVDEFRQVTIPEQAAQIAALTSGFIHILWEAPPTSIATRNASSKAAVC